VNEPTPTLPGDLQRLRWIILTAYFGLLLYFLLNTIVVTPPHHAGNTGDLVDSNSASVNFYAGLAANQSKNLRLDVFRGAAVFHPRRAAGIRSFQTLAGNHRDLTFHSHVHGHDRVYSAIPGTF
jgi:hypothetical protein